MSRRFYLIDGYNLLHAAGFARARYGPGDLHRARVRMLALIDEHLDEDSRQRIEIIFDAQDPPADYSAQMRIHGMRVRYSVETGDADALIEELIRDHSAPRQLWVVSSDHRLIDAAKRRRAKSLTSEVFLDRLFEGRIDRRPRETPVAPPDAPESATDWLAFFGFDAASTIDINLDPADETFPPISFPVDENPPVPDQQQPARTHKGESSKDAAETSDEGHPGSFAIEAEFWQRRIDELFQE